MTISTVLVVQGVLEIKGLLSLSSPVKTGKSDEKSNNFLASKFLVKIEDPKKASVKTTEIADLVSLITEGSAHPNFLVKKTLFLIKKGPSRVKDLNSLEKKALFQRMKGPSQVKDLDFLKKKDLSLAIDLSSDFLGSGPQKDHPKPLPKLNYSMFVDLHASRCARVHTTGYP